MDFKMAIDRIRNAIYGVEVRECIAVMGEYLEEYFHECASKIGDAIQSAKDAAASASEAKQALSDTKEAKADAVEAIEAAETDALTSVANATTDAKTAARNASASASAAAKSETNAGTKASEAAGSASAAEVSAKAAEASANKAAAAAGTDKTLSIADVPADSKTVGDALDGKLATTSAGYVKSVSVSGNTMTITKGDGTSQSEQLAESYTLPAATADTLGGVKVGAELDIAADGTISAETLAAKIQAVAASNYEPRLVWTSTVSNAKRKATFAINVPSGVDYVYVKPKVQMTNSNSTLTTLSISVPRGQSKNYVGAESTVYDDKYVKINITFSEDGVLTIEDKGGYYLLNQYEVEGYHYLTYADILEQIESVSANVTALQTAQEDTDALLVDQEYRLTLLELGITE